MGVGFCRGVERGCGRTSHTACRAWWWWEVCQWVVIWDETWNSKVGQVGWGWGLISRLSIGPCGYTLRERLVVDCHIGPMYVMHYGMRSAVNGLCLHICYFCILLTLDPFTIFFKFQVYFGTILCNK